MAVSVSKPKIGGAVYRALLSSSLTLPTDATTALGSDFVQLGYVSEDGITNDNTPESDVVKAFGGDTVLTFENGKEDTFGFTLIDSTNVDVLKAVYGSGNVTGTLSTGITVKANSLPQEAAAWVFELVLADGVVKRIVIPEAKITELGTITYNDTTAVGYETTITAVQDASGNTHYEYLKG